ncbi:MAG: DNA polymerase III subunit gamma/tau [Gammaproteobacteria bacterium]|nr:DNA polymerase III subunit gamma/tau [Gammaproteobacteria bacterium]
MSYQVLARKYRPGTLAEVVGQPQTVKALVNAFDRQQLHHAYLFSGTRGVGKTTLARIIAKCLNCETGVTSTPCGICANCVAIADGSFVDLIEVDGASRNKVEETRELLEDIAYLATMGTYKVYIIDEVHALSDSSFQTLLKSLEEPPEHVKFVLATTNPDKVPVTVRSRCIQFHLRTMSIETIDEHLRSVLDQEGIRYDDASVRTLARLGQGSMRDALSLTDQAIALCGTDLAEAAVVDMLGCAPQNDVALILEHLVRRDRDGLFSAVAELVARGVDFSEVLAGLENGVHSLAMAKATHTSPDEALVDLLDQCETAWLQQAYQVLIMGGRDLQYAPEPRVGFEMTMLRLLDFVPIKIEDSAPEPTGKSTENVERTADSVTPVVSNSTDITQASATQTDIGSKSPEERRKTWQEQPIRMQAKRTEERRAEKERTANAKEAAMQVFTSEDEPPYVQILKDRFDAEFDAEWLDDENTQPR